MKSSKSAKLLLIALLAVHTFMLTSFSAVFAESDEDLEDYISQCHAPEELYDPEVMATTMAGPEVFLQFIEELKKPATTKAMLQCLSSPEQWETMTTRMTDPTKMMNAMVVFMNPQPYVSWMGASMNPQTYEPFIAFMSPEFYAQWLAAIMNTEIYQEM